MMKRKTEWPDCGALGTLNTWLLAALNGTITLENFLAAPCKVKIQLSYDQAVPFLGIYSKGTKPYVH